MTAHDLYAQTIRALPADERFRLVALILDELMRSGVLPAAADSGDCWSQRDRDDLTAFSLSYAEALYPEDEELI